MATVLIVDDQKSALLMLDSILTKHGHTSALCMNTRDAIAYLEKNPVDLMITDAIMPGVSGFDLIKAVRSNPKYQHIGIIMVTGRRERKDVEQSLKVGADDFVVKPVDPDILMAKVKGLLDKKTSSSAGDFFECSVKIPASWVADTHIVSLSEVGLTLTSSLQLPIGYKTKLDSELFTTIQIDPPTIRITNCYSHSAGSNLFTIHAHFVGLTEKELQAIRVYLFKQGKPTSAA